MANTPLMKKLRIQPGQRIHILNTPEGYLDLLGHSSGPPSGPPPVLPYISQPLNHRLRPNEEDEK